MEFSVPKIYQITPEPFFSPGFEKFLVELDATLASGIKLVQLRAKDLDRHDHLKLAGSALNMCRNHGALLILNGSIELAMEADCDGVHLNSQALMSCEERPGKINFVSAACHNVEQIAQAGKIGVDFITVSPIFKTKTHPDAIPMGWHGFVQLVAGSKIPVFALGGMRPEMMEDAQRHGAWGIAAISATWRSSGNQ